MSKIPWGLSILSRKNKDWSNYKTGWQAYIWILTYLIYVSSHCARKPISVVKTILNPINSTHGWVPFDKNTGKTLLGGLDSAFLFGYAVGMLAFANIVERMGIRLVLSITNIFAAIFTALFGVGYFFSIHNYLYYFFVQLMCGFAMSASWPCVVAVMCNWSSFKLRGLISGIWTSNAFVGNIVGTLIATAFLTGSWGWSFVIPGLILLFFAMFVFLFLVERPESLGIEISHYNPIENQGDEEYSDQSISMSNLFRIPNIILYAIAAFFLKLTSYTLLYWLPVYILHKSKGTLTPEQSGIMSAYYDMGSVFGVIVGGFLTDFLKKRVFVCQILSFCSCPLLFLFNMYGMTSYLYSAAMLVFIGFTLNGCFGLLVTAVSIDLAHDPLVKKMGRSGAAITGFLDGIGSLGAAVGPIVAGYISSYSWDYLFYLLMSSVVLCVLALIKPSTNELLDRKI